MERDEITPSLASNDQQERGVGGKVRKPPPRKPAPSPYARPAESQRRWISKLVDPACRLIAGGATRIFPYFFSEPASTSALTGPSCDTENQGDSQIVEESDKDNDLKCNLPTFKSIETESTSHVTGELEGKSDLDLHILHRKEESENSKLSEIEQLVKGKRFSRDELNRLMEILNSKVTYLPNIELQKENVILPARKDEKGLSVEHGLQKVSNEQSRGELKGAIWGSSTPLGLSKVQEEIGASPIDIARAYMDSRALEAGPSSKSIKQIGESTVLPGTGAAGKPYIPSASPNLSICWPGAVAHDAYSTPQSQRGRYGLYDFPRTPYSRTILSKSKSRSIHRQSDHNRISSTPLHQLQTPLYDKDKSRSDVLEGGFGSVGPIRRVRHKVVAQSSSRRPTYFNSPLGGPSQRESSDVHEGFLHTKSLETSGTSSPSKFHSSDNKSQASQMGAPTVHMHTSLMARKILEHIDRNPPTPKEKSTELKLATRWKNPESSVDVDTILSNENNSLLKFKDVGPYKYNELDGKKLTPRNEGSGRSNVDLSPKLLDKSVHARTEGLAADMNVGRSILGFGNDARTSPNSVNFSMKSSEEDALKILTSGSQSSGLIIEKNPVIDASVSKSVLPSISISKPDSRWPFAPDNNSGFTFPVSASSSVLSEPPTPSILPSFSASGQNQSKERCVEPSYSFGLKRSSPALVFSFPSTSSTAVHSEAGDIKFNFGSNEKARLSFSSFAKNAIAIK